MRTAAVRRELGFPKSDELPGQWTWELVNLRLVEAFEAEPNLPGEYSTRTSRVRPDHLYDDADLAAQDEADEETKAARATAGSRVKLLPHQMSLVLLTLKWPADYIAAADEKLSLAPDPAHSRIVRRVARGLARGRSPSSRASYGSLSRGCGVDIGKAASASLPGCGVTACRCSKYTARMR